MIERAQTLSLNDSKNINRIVGGNMVNYSNWLPTRATANPLLDLSL